MPKIDVSVGTPSYERLRQRVLEGRATAEEKAAVSAAEARYQASDLAKPPIAESAPGVKVEIPDPQVGTE